jgi:hypothetical protein
MKSKAGTKLTIAAALALGVALVCALPAGMAKAQSFGDPVVAFGTAPAPVPGNPAPIEAKLGRPTQSHWTIALDRADHRFGVPRPDLEGITGNGTLSFTYGPSTQYTLQVACWPYDLAHKVRRGVVNHLTVLVCLPGQEVNVRWPDQANESVWLPVCSDGVCP